ncbi:MAG: DUF4384 domain-containing protein [Saprospiraceae bacterium]|nr:DUF4384 domain-containing protein [Saprospiraceae bacterium]
MEIIPVEVNEKEEEVRRLSINDFTDPDGLIRFPEGTHIKIKVSNPGILPAYFTLIDIEPYQRFTIVAPEEGSSETAEEYRIAPGAKLEIPKVFRVAPPYGQEMFKLIYTRNPIDLRSIKASNGAIRRGMANATSLEKLFSDSFFTEELQSRGGQTTRTSPGEMGVFSLNFMIEPKG